MIGHWDEIFKYLCDFWGQFLWFVLISCLVHLLLLDHETRASFLTNSKEAPESFSRHFQSADVFLKR